MSAHFAPPFFSYLLGKCLKRQNPLFEVLKLGLVVIGAFSLVWWPYMQSANAFLEVLSRLAPFERGICEDYVANFWCTTSVLVKWKRLFTIPSLKLLSFGATISASLSSMIQQIWAPSKQGFLYGRLNTSLSFYMFSYQVHEKSILLPLLPSSFLVMEEPFLFKQMMHYSLLSMFPLLCRDELIFPYISLSALLSLLYLAAGRRQDTTERNSPANLRSFMIGFLVLCSLNINAVCLAMRIPKKYPFLFEAMIMLLCFSQFVFVDGYTPT